jgi:hypothetical protein
VVKIRSRPRGGRSLINLKNGDAVIRILLGVLTSCFAFSHLAQADSILCNLIDQPNASEVRLDYSEEIVSDVYLRSPGDTVYRPLPVTINMVVRKSETKGQSEAILVKPIPPKDINWEEIESCYLEVGTTWYFEFSYARDAYQVQFVPFYAVEFPRCVTPRVKPQTHRLGCRGATF